MSNVDVASSGRARRCDYSGLVPAFVSNASALLVAIGKD